MRKPHFILLLLFTVGLFACTQADEAPTPTAVAEKPAPTAAPTNTAVSTPTTPPTPTVTQNTAVPTQPTEHAWPPPAKTYSEFSRQPITQAEQLTFDILETDLPPDRDDVALAVAYRGITVPSDNPPLVTEPQSVGTSQPFFVSTYDTNVTTSPEFLLQYVSDHAYFWFDTTPGLTPPDAETLADMGAAFDDIYEKDTFFFGDEANPGVDGDPRVHIVNAAPPTICGDTNACGLLGYVATSNMLPTAVYPTSNQREMFVMNGTAFGSQTYLDVLAHEFRHMIENRYDVNDVDWAVEGSAMLAEDLLGFESDSIFRGNLFLADPDQQLNRWTDGNTIPYYGQGYVMNRYLFNRLGTDLYRVFATHPDPGFLAVDAIAAENGLDFTGLELWLDWLAALAIHNEPNAPEIYALRDGLETAATTVINTFPFNVDTTVNQFAADYYRLSGSGPATLDFTGSNHVPLLAARPLSGETMWVANRANYSMVSMTHAFDLTQVDKATLEYAVFHEIEAGYDFAYASISTDGGRTWQGLTAENMQGTDPVDDPSDVAYTDRFYTGNSDDWVQETADLTPYVGQTVHIRFEYVTDPILTFGGIAFDNIAIPEIGFYDDVESDAGWEAHGFVRAAGYLPQRWHLILITFKDDTPVVQHIPISDDNTATFEFSLNSSGGGRPFLIVAASSPMTLEPAHYQFEIR